MTDGAVCWQPPPSSLPIPDTTHHTIPHCGHTTSTTSCFYTPPTDHRTLSWPWQWRSFYVVHFLFVSATFLLVTLFFCTINLALFSIWPNSMLTRISNVKVCCQRSETSRPHTAQIQGSLRNEQTCSWSRATRRPPAYLLSCTLYYVQRQHQSYCLCWKCLKFYLEFYVFLVFKNIFAIYSSFLRVGYVCSII